jgi:hypothetical protein
VNLSNRPPGWTKKLKMEKNVDPNAVRNTAHQATFPFGEMPYATSPANIKEIVKCPPTIHKYFPRCLSTESNYL